MNDPGDGLVSERDGHRLEMSTTTAKAGEQTTVRFRIVDAADGMPVTSFLEAQTKKMHVYLIRTDLTGFQHVHPTLSVDGTWSVPVRFLTGSYRVFTDFTVMHANAPDTIALSRTIEASGPAYLAKPLGAESRRANVDGYDVSLDGDVMADTDSPLTITITKNSAPVTNLETYLGTYAHVTAFRSSDLAFAHLHPEQSATPSSGKGGPRLTAMAHLAESGSYRVFVQFMDAHALHTAVFTVHAMESMGMASPMTDHSSHG